MPFTDLLVLHAPGAQVVVSDLPAGTARVWAEDAWGRRTDAALARGCATVPGLRAGTYVLEAASAGGAPLGGLPFTVARAATAAPVPAFATGFGPGDDPARIADWTFRLRANLIQMYDWMERYAAPEPSADRYEDPLGRPLDRRRLSDLIRRIRAQGGVAQAYAAVPAAEPAFARGHPKWALAQGDGVPEHLADLLEIMNPGDPGWVSHWLSGYAPAAEHLGFGALHLDTYGYPRAAADQLGRPVDMSRAYASFRRSVREAMPTAELTFNQVNGAPGAMEAMAGPSARYVEVWPPNDELRHLEPLLFRAGRRGDSPAIVALYPPSWADDRPGTLRTALLADAVITMAGADALTWGDAGAALCEAYYPRHVRLTEAERDTVVAHRHFALRYRDLWRTGRDTTWEDVGGANTGVTVRSDAVASPEALGGALHVRVRRGRGWTAVGITNLTGSAHGRWTEPSAGPSPMDAVCTMLVHRPQAVRLFAARLGRDGGRMVPLAHSLVAHEEGLALEARIEALDGWTVILARTAGAR